VGRIPKTHNLSMARIEVMKNLAAATLLGEVEVTAWIGMY
jgi:hypothetical protein